ncbi:MULTISPECIES: DUF6107 family protein [unclassified Roseitalea]|uniref:DUF6107 family protein n=1 Tax=unclassified Roseitalea TaxID=2639107 RepID=UPI00273F20F3|nr:MULTISPECIES: DUF6107 family protein [unclassified Roseitalea]
MSEIPANGSLWLAKAVGAVAGSAISLAYLLPHTRREAAIRFLTGVAAGFVFGTTVGVAIADRFGIAEVLSEVETVLMGAAVASLTIWWALGVAIRAADRRTGSDARATRASRKTRGQGDDDDERATRS